MPDPLAVNFRQMLAQRGFHVAEASKQMNVSIRTFDHWKAGQRRPTPAHALAAERYFNIPKSLLRPDIWPPSEVEQPATETVAA